MQAEDTTVCGELMISALSDAELLANARGLIGRTNQVLAALLAHLGEVDARGLYRQRACSSLFAYCVYELRLSEDEAVRRVAAARLAREFPELLDTIAAGELHLTGLLLLGPHLTRENFGGVMARARHRTKKEIEKLVRVLDPLPDVPALIEALGPAHPAAMRQATWAEQVASFGPVRELTPGDRPRDWVTPEELSAPARTTEPLRYKVQFTATEEYVNLMERAAALLSNRGEQNGIEELHLRAVRLLVERLEKRRSVPRQSLRRLRNPPRPRSRRTPRGTRPSHRSLWFGAPVTSRPAFAALSSSGTARAARTATTAASVAARPTTWSSTTSCRSRKAANILQQISRSGVLLTTLWPPSSTSARSTSLASETHALTNLQGAPLVVPTDALPHGSPPRGLIAPAPPTRFASLLAGFASLAGRARFVETALPRRMESNHR